MTILKIVRKEKIWFNIIFMQDNKYLNYWNINLSNVHFYNLQQVIIDTYYSCDKIQYFEMQIDFWYKKKLITSSKKDHQVLFTIRNDFYFFA